MSRCSRLLFIGVTSVLAIIAVVGCGSNPRNIEELAGANDEIRVYEVFGMDCPGCHDGVENLVNRLDGVIASQANWKKQLLTVVISQSGGVTDGMILEAINKANFTPGKRLR